MAFHNKQEETPSNEIKAGFTFLNFGTNCLKLVSPKHGSGGISPVAAYRSKQPGAVCQGCINTAVYRRLALDWRPRLFYFPAARRGYILQSRTLSHDWERAGDWVEHERRFTYELYQQSLRAYEERDPAQSSPHPAEGTGRNALCGVFLLARDRLCFLLSGTP